MLSMIYKTFEIVVVPFPFVDSAKTKNRPALVISSAQSNAEGNTVLMMITSALHERWFLDTEISNLPQAGLSKGSMIRPKLFTIDNRLIKEKIGALSAKDRTSFIQNFHQLFSDLIKK